MYNSAPTAVDKSSVSFEEMLAVTIVFIGVMYLLFYTQFSSGFNLLTGDRFDGLIQNSILEHWYNVLRGESHWNAVGYFYPYANTLGYNDGYFIYGLIHSFFRVLHLDLFLAADLVNITFKIIGFYSFYILCRNRHYLGLPPFIALAGSVIFTLGNSLIVQAGHAQLFSVTLSPLLALLIYRYVNLLLTGNRTKASILYGSLSGLLLSAWLITTYYMAWFFILFTILMVMSCLVITLVGKLRHKESRFNAPFRKIEIIIPAIVTIIALVPFLRVYLPAAKNTGMHTFDDVFTYTPHLANLLDPGSENFLFGRLSEYIFSTWYPSLDRGGEMLVGFPPFILIVSIFAAIYFWKKSTFTVESVLIRSLIAAIVISIVVMVRIGEHSLWKIVWNIIPGAKGLRVTARYALFLTFPLAMLVTYYLSKLSTQKSKLLIFFLGCLLMAEQINLHKNSFLNRQDQLDFINHVSAPPAACTSFYVSGQRPAEFGIQNKNAIINIYPHNVDAMLLAEVFALRTINGFSTFNPPDWDFMRDPEETYLKRIASYVNKHQIQHGMCELDLFTSRWRPVGAPNLIGLAPLSKQDITLMLTGIPILSADKSYWHIDVKVTNSSANPLGSETLYPVNLGIRGLAVDGKLAKRDMLRVPVPRLNAGGESAVINIKLPVGLLTSEKIDIVPVQEGIAWLDDVGIQPLMIVLK